MMAMRLAFGIDLMNRSETLPSSVPVSVVVKM